MFFNQYKDVSDGFSVDTAMQQPKAPSLLLFNESLFKQLGLEWQEQEKVRFLSGLGTLEQCSATSLAYSGHQFGHFNPTLGDGRAHYLGSLKNASNEIFDLQLKGSGATSFSRGGDGLCALGPAVREFVMSQAIKSLGIKTTECLSVIATGEQVYRQGYLPGAVVCRVASGHIRVGSFQYLALKQDKQGMHNLMELAISRHFPFIKESGDERIFAFFRAVCEAQVTLVVEWMRVGFIHGVMNTDNCLVSGETIDYGPCAMMESFSFDAVFSSIDRQGRYAFGNQPNITQWNCARLAECLLLMFAVDEQQTVEKLSSILQDSAKVFNVQYQAMWAKKLGLLEWHEEDSKLLSALLELMENNKLDYTNTFAALTAHISGKAKSTFEIPKPLIAWFEQWQKRIASYEQTKVSEYMCGANPAIIPRNELVEQVIDEFYSLGKSATLDAWLPLLSKPYSYRDYKRCYTQQQQSKEKYQTFCGT